MNRYPLWKYLVLAAALLIGTLYTLPNFFGEAPAVQVSAARTSVKVDAGVRDRVLGALADAKITPDFVQWEGNSVRARFSDTDVQIKAKDAISKALNRDPAEPDYVVALNLVSRSPQWLAQIRAFPMYLGLDLRGGVHFLLEVDMKAAISKKVDALMGDARMALREKKIRASVARVGDSLVLNFTDAATRDTARNLLSDRITDMTWEEAGEGQSLTLTGRFKPTSLVAVQDAALKQNINTLHNRVNELGTAEPVIQQQGLNRVVVQLPGVQDTARAKGIIGRTATLEVRMVEAHGQQGVRDYDPGRLQAALAGDVPSDMELLYGRDNRGNGPEPLLVSKQLVFTGDNLNRADANFDQQGGGGSVVVVGLDSAGAASMKATTRDGVKRRMAVILVEKGKKEVLTAPTIQSELSASFHISGMANPQEATDLALLMRAGQLAAPMDIIEERTIGPSLGAENIARGFQSVIWGFVAVAVFMCGYYMLFGVFSSLALGFNLLMLVAVLSMMQATLSLPGMAAIALVLGMAIDSNVLINERIREELRAGVAPQTAIHIGYERAWATILDSNVTTLIAGLALLAFGSGPVKGFAVVHCLGILTSMFSAVMFSRGLVNLWYGRQRKLSKVSIGQVWRPATQPATKDGEA
jgi:preprotein translocase subunit SecD